MNFDRQGFLAGTALPEDQHVDIDVGKHLGLAMDLQRYLADEPVEAHLRDLQISQVRPAEQSGVGHRRIGAGGARDGDGSQHLAGDSCHTGRAVGQ